jgi:hypothetical protein
LDVAWLEDSEQLFRLTYAAEPGRPVAIQTSTNGIDWRYVAEAVSAAPETANAFNVSPSLNGLAMPAGDLRGRARRDECRALAVCRAHYAHWNQPGGR